MVSAIIIFPNVNTNAFDYPFDMIIKIIVYSLMITIIGHVVYYLLNKDNPLYGVLALIVGGVGLTLIFICARWIYKKLEFDFLD
jgi:uncharacterized membrane protein YjjB (DUF3815 family)